MRPLLPIASILLILQGSTLFHSTNAFSSSSSSSSPIQNQINIVQVDPTTYDTPNDQIMQVASYRNNRTSPEQMIAAQKLKRESFDPVKSAMDGVKIGLGIGFAAGIVTALNAPPDDGTTNAIITGATNFAVIGGVTASLLGFNNYSGNRVYVMDEKEARNRLTVDFVASLKISQDIGFAAYLDETQLNPNTYKNGRFEGCSGIVGCVDCQLRNSKYNTVLEGGVTPKFYQGFGPHVHVKNMDVDTEMRRNGIAVKLMDSIEAWAKAETDAEELTLEVQDTNEAAVNLYQGCGFVKDENQKARRADCSFMRKSIR